MKKLLGAAFSMISVCSFSCADVSAHFKKAVEKGTRHKMRNIDFIYMINLDERPEKFAAASEQLRPYGIYPYRFSAVNGWELSCETIDDVGLKYEPGMTPLMATTFPKEADDVPNHEFMKEYGKTYFSHCMARGPIGIALSHLSVLQDAWDAGYQTIWVMEDDIEVIQNPHLLPELIEELDALVGKNNWDVLFTDQDTKNREGTYVPAYGACKRPDMDCSIEGRCADRYMDRSEISPDFRRVTARFGAYSMIIRRSGIKKLLEFACEHHIFLPYDMENYLHPDIRRYCFTFDVVSTVVDALSDNGAPYYKQKGLNP